MAKVVVLASLPESLLNFRGALLSALVAAGHEVHALSPPAEPSIVAALGKIGVTHHSLPLSRTALNPLRDLQTVRALAKLLRALRPQHLFAYTIKAVIYGGIVARFSPVGRFHALISGLGYTFNTSSLGGRLLAVVVRLAYRSALFRAQCVFFQNTDNLQVFQRYRLLRNPAAAILVNGSGVDLDRFRVAPLPSAPIFLMIGRLLRDKGVVEYVEAARQVKARHPQAVFRLAGWIDAHPDAISVAQLDAWLQEGVIEYLGYLDDVRDAIAAASVYCLPSYHEGMPRTVLESMAMGRPILTTDVPGCRATVVEDVNGYLVSARDVTGLVRAMERFVLEPQTIPRMGSASRRIAVEKFDVNQVNAVMLGAMGLRSDDTR